MKIVNRHTHTHTHAHTHTHTHTEKDENIIPPWRPSYAGGIIKVLYPISSAIKTRFQGQSTGTGEKRFLR